MKKLVLGGVVSLALAAGSLFLPAQAADFEGCASDAPGIGNPAAANAELCGGGSMDGTGYVYLEGAEGNEDPFDGYVSASNDGTLDENGVCASDEGDAQEEYDAEGNRIEDNEEQPTCVNP